MQLVVSTTSRCFEFTQDLFRLIPCCTARCSSYQPGSVGYCLISTGSYGLNSSTLVMLKHETQLCFHFVVWILSLGVAAFIIIIISPCILCLMVTHFPSNFFSPFSNTVKKKKRKKESKQSGALKLYLFCYPLMLHGE